MRSAIYKVKSLAIKNGKRLIVLKGKEAVNEVKLERRSSPRMKCLRLLNNELN